MTQAFQRTTGTEMIQVSYAIQAAAGATGTKTATDQGGDAPDHGNTHILALKPGGGCPVLAETIGPESGESRYSSTLPFDNVNDFHGFDSNTAVPSGIRNIDGTSIAGLDGYRVTVSVAGQSLGAIGNDAYGNPQSLLITVTVTGPSETTVTLHGYRTRYAPNALP
jgi:MSHA pilin protein MshD